MMRITSSMMSENILNSLQKNTESLMKAQTVVSSGLKINQPSDDPVGMAAALNYNATISSVNQYTANIKQAETTLNVADSTLSGVSNLLTQAKQIALQMVNGTMSATDRSNAASQVQSLLDQFVQMANTKQGNFYVFGGRNTTTAPYDTTNPSSGFQGDDGQMPVVVGNGVTIDTHVSGKNAFSATTSATAVDPAVVLSNLITGLKNNDTTAISNQLTPLDTALDQVVNTRSDIGNTLNRLDATQSYWSSFKLNIQKALSNTEDADLTQAASDLTQQQTAYQASLSVAAKIIQPTLLDFLK